MDSETQKNIGIDSNKDSNKLFFKNNMEVKHGSKT